MSAKPDPDRLLVFLLELVPECPRYIRQRLMSPRVYDTILGIIADYGTDDKREWSDLAQIIRQEQALLRAAGLP